MSWGRCNVYQPNAAAARRRRQWGLTGQLWINVPVNTNLLAQAQAIIVGGFATANFLATTIDFPSGPARSTSVFATYGSVLDATAIATLDDSSVLTDDVQNTVMRFAGFFGVRNPNEVWTFHIPSDDGSAVDIQGTRVLNNDGIHNSTTNCIGQTSSVMPGGWSGPTREVPALTGSASRP